MCVCVWWVEYMCDVIYGVCVWLVEYMYDVIYGVCVCVVGRVHV